MIGARPEGKPSPDALTPADRAMLNRLKDKVVSQAARAWLESKLGRYGEIREFHIDTGSKQIRLVLLPRGEASPIELKVTRYEVLRNPGGKCLVVRGVESSREWVGLVATEYLAGKELPLPPGVGDWLG